MAIHAIRRRLGRNASTLREGCAFNGVALSFFGWSSSGVVIAWALAHLSNGRLRSQTKPPLRLNWLAS